MRGALWRCPVARTAAQCSPSTRRSRDAARVGKSARGPPRAVQRGPERVGFRAAGMAATSDEVAARDPSSEPARVVRVWTRADTDGRLLDGGAPWEASLEATPEIRLVAGSSARASSDDADTSAFDPVAFFDAARAARLGRVLYTAATLASTQSMLQTNMVHGSKPDNRQNRQQTHALPRGSRFPTGTVVVADRQVSGRGRGGNAWTSPDGCLMFSFLATHADGRTLPFLQYVATMAAVDAIQDCADEALAEAAAAHDERVVFRRGSGKSVDVRVKWPNDLYSGGLKIGGVLCTSTYTEGAFDVVVGVGLNLDNDAPTTCVNAIIGAAWDAILAESEAQKASESGERRAGNAADAENKRVKQTRKQPRDVSRERLAAGFMNRFEALCGLLNHAGGFEPLEPAYLRQWLHTDQKVVLEEGGGAKTEVTVRGLTKTGYLLATDAAGARFELHPDGNSFDFFQGLVKKKLP